MLPGGVLEERRQDLEERELYDNTYKEKTSIPDTRNRMFYPEELEAKTYVMKEDGKQVTKETRQSK